ncbi:MAG: response regulator, partial [Deltaproteobacteria bacterium]|nr:response regulator [Deltaproteobacteria bacterium]
MKKILVLESDSMVVDALANEFAVFGCMVDAVDDAEMARQKASSDEFSLVVISTSLAKSHGFLAFTFLKRLPELENTPFVIMFNEGEADQIVSHQNRPTHADVYLQKPFDFNDLLVQVMGFLDVEDQVRALVEGEGAESTEEIELDDDVVIEDEVVEALPEISDEEMAALDTPTEAETFEEAPAVVAGEEETVVEEAPVEEAVEIEADEEAVEIEADEEAVEIEADEEIVVEEETEDRVSEIEPMEDAAPAPAVDEGAQAEAAEKITVLEAEIATLKSQMEEAEIRVSDADKDRRDAVQEVDTLKSKNEDLEKTLTEKGSASVGTRELLDLRELINRKDKEILNLKDDLNSKEKGLLEERDKTMEAQRSNADLEEKVLSTEKEMSSIQATLAAMAKDKEAASKRADDFKAHWDSVLEEIESLKKAGEENETKFKAEAEEAQAAALQEQEIRLTEEKDAEVGSLKASQERALEEQKEQYEA